MGHTPKVEIPGCNLAGAVESADIIGISEGGTGWKCKEESSQNCYAGGAGAFGGFHGLVCLLESFFLSAIATRRPAEKCIFANARLNRSIWPRLSGNSSSA